MKNVFLSIFFLFFAGLVSMESASAQNDTVCAGATGIHYKITGDTGSTFSWVVNGGILFSTTTIGDSISINWNNTAGIDTLKVVEIGVMGCPGDTFRLAVVRLKPTIVLSGTDSICNNSATVLSKLNMTLTGVGPWSVNYTEDGTAKTQSITTSPYTFNSQTYTSAGVKAYTITSVTDNFGCTGTYSGSASVTVFPKPITSPIIRY